MPTCGVYHDYDLMANEHVKKQHNCIVCGSELAANVRWSDYHGEGICMTCGTPYQLLHYENDKRVEKPPIINIKPEYIPKLQKYWNETHRPMSLGTYMGRNPEPENQKAFYEWFDKQEKSA